jgi:hypothetical protein
LLDTNNIPIIESSDYSKQILTFHNVIEGEEIREEEVDREGSEGEGEGGEEDGN